MFGLLSSQLVGVPDVDCFLDTNSLYCLQSSTWFFLDCAGKTSGAIACLVLYFDHFQVKGLPS